MKVAHLHSGDTAVQLAIFLPDTGRSSSFIEKQVLAVNYSVFISPWIACCLINTNFWGAESICRTARLCTEIVNLLFSRHFHSSPWLVTYLWTPCSVQNMALYKNLLKCLSCHSDFLKEWTEIQQNENPFWCQCSPWKISPYVTEGHSTFECVASN